MTVQRLPIEIDRSSPVPLYHQLAEQLSASIASGVLQPGDPFENEVAVAERLQLSRPTVRRAIQELVDQGMLVRRRGLGTRVANRKVHRKAELSSLFDDLQRDGRQPRTTVVEHEIVTDDRAAAALDLAPDTPLLHLARVRMAGDSPLALMHNWLPPAYSDLTREELGPTASTRRSANAASSLSSPSRRSRPACRRPRSAGPWPSRAASPC
jgi:DNA-binding GntR family transcriptional regulator